ncbi:hypothetical protein L596_028818 [Steinernema carpocapsae]|uniref:Uncharacterized protein n=1 Tax=Steinernema carpocapsae TaxID=34508 RepID=A0A4U5LZH4_STECR|nr:hypothetical protein L596_028818 [Steinernema carpocapsae]
MALKDEGVFIVVEVVEVVPSDDSDNPDLATLGWTICPIYNIGQIMTDYNPSGIFNQPSKRIHLFEGSPSILATNVNGPLESISGIYKQGVSRILECYLQTHEKMSSVLDFIPEYVFFTQDDHIPGLEVDKKEQLSQLCRPQITLKSTVLLDQISISFGERAAQIEEAIISLTTQDWMYSLNQTHDQFLKNKKMEIIERRLKVGIHNGYTYIDEPYCMSMVAKDELMSKSHSLRRRLGTGWVSEENIKSELETFMVRNTLKLDRIFNHSTIAIVFSVYYVVGIRNEDLTVEMSKNEMVCWGAWCPENLYDVSEVSVPLIGGPNPNPDHHLCFKNLLRIREHETDSLMGQDGRPRIELTFQCTPVKTPARRSSFQIAETDAQFAHHTVNSSELLKMPSEPLPSTSQEMRDFMSEEVEEDFSKPKQEIEIPKNLATTRVESFCELATRVLTISRQSFVLLSQFKFREITDRNGNVPVLIDADDNRDFNVPEEVKDRLQVNEVFMQFLGTKGEIGHFGCVFRPVIEALNQQRRAKIALNFDGISGFL